MPTGLDSTLFVFLTPLGEALVIAMTPDGAVADTQAIPELGKDLADAGLSVRDDGTVVISRLSSDTYTYTDIDTSRW